MMIEKTERSEEMKEGFSYYCILELVMMIQIRNRTKPHRGINRDTKERKN